MTMNFEDAGLADTVQRVLHREESEEQEHLFFKHNIKEGDLLPADFSDNNKQFYFVKREDGTLSLARPRWSNVTAPILTQETRSIDMDSLYTINPGTSLRIKEIGDDTIVFESMKIGDAPETLAQDESETSAQEDQRLAV